LDGSGPWSGLRRYIAQRAVLACDPRTGWGARLTP
jgi:hypothetical protein